MFYFVGKILSSILFKLTGGLGISGKDNIPDSGPLIIVSNHQSIIDPFVLMVSFPKKIRFLAAAYLFKIHGVRLFLYTSGAMPVKSRRGDLKSLKKSLALLEKGETIGIFPEGGVSLDGKLKPFMQGWAYLALKTGAKVLPITISGSRQVLPVGKYIPRRGKIFVNIGKPRSLPKKNKISRKDLEQINEKMEKEMKYFLNICQ